MQVPKCRRSNMTQSKDRHKNANSSDTKTIVKAERSGLSETAQTVKEKAEEIKATEEKSVSSVAESVPKHENSVRSDRFTGSPRYPKTLAECQMMDEVETTTKMANETMKEGDIPTKIGEYEKCQ